jgi:hypothetical protein
VLPSTARLVADVGHTLAHVIEDGNRRNGRSSSATMVHTHDGSTHSHRIGIGQLLESADRADDDEPTAAVLVIMSSHLPIDAPALRFASHRDVRPTPEARTPKPSATVLPTVPPPRA